jgi:hypothetical protein
MADKENKKEKVAASEDTMGMTTDYPVRANAYPKE